MALVATDSGKSYPPAPAGTHRAVCVQVIDIGTQYSRFYDKWSHKVLLGWELVDEQNEDGEPWLVWNRYTLSLHENSALRGHLQSWRGRPFTEQERKGFHLENVLGAPCMLNLTHREDDGKTYADVSAVMALPKGMEKPTPKHELIMFDVDNWDQKVFETFRENLQKTICASKEAEAQGRKPVAGDDGIGHAEPVSTRPSGGGTAPIDDDDIPF